MRSVSGRTRTGERPRLLALAYALVGLGVVVHGGLSYQVLQAGGFTTTSMLGACARAATGRVTTTYRMSEQLRVDHAFFPPSATCRWSGGSSASLVAPAWWGWTGLVLVAVGLVGLVLLRLAGRRRRPRP